MNLDFEWAKLKSTLETFVRLCHYYHHYVSSDVLTGKGRGGIYYVGSNDNNVYISTLLDILTHVPTEVPERALELLKSNKTPVIEGAWGVNEKLIRGVSTPFGVLWFDGAPGRTAPKYHGMYQYTLNGHFSINIDTPNKSISK